MPKKKNWLSDIVVEICCIFCLNKVTGLIKESGEETIATCCECKRKYKLKAYSEILGGE